MAESAGGTFAWPGSWELGLAGRQIEEAGADTEVLLRGTERLSIN